MGSHGEARLAEVRRRLVESWGDQAVPHGAAQRILRSMIDWAVLQDSQQRGAYLQGSKEAISSLSLAR